MASIFLVKTESKLVVENEERWHWRFHEQEEVANCEE